MTDNEELADAIRSLRVHEQGSNKYDNVRTCLAFDTIQAAILNEKLKIFSERNRRPQQGRSPLQRRAFRRGHSPDCAGWLNLGLGTIYYSRIGARWACRGAQGGRHSDRDLLSHPSAPAASLQAFFFRKGGVGVSDRLASEVMSLPMYAYLCTPTQDHIIDATRRALKS